MDQDYKPGPLPFPIILVCGFIFFEGGGGQGQIIDADPMM